ncbi:MAG: Arm DNA-binding domain-containing protein [Burkholderiaceae bacterium]|jgi:hypothetical protein|nr:Arm DNA-binding domain-containing protein [Burkholderiaceae bacterium]
MLLSDTFIRKVKHSGRPAGDKHADGGGLYLHVTEAGRYWRLRYRFAGKEKLLAFGTYPAISLAQARQRRDEAKEQLADGVDPSAVKKADKLAAKNAALNSFQAVAEQWVKMRCPTWSKSHEDKTRQLLRRDIYPELGALPIDAITSAKVLAMARKIEARQASSSVPLFGGRMGGRKARRLTQVGPGLPTRSGCRPHALMQARRKLS